MGSHVGKTARGVHLGNQQAYDIRLTAALHEENNPVALEENIGRSCVCEGSNENCRFCYGTGQVADTLAAAIIARRGKAGLKKTRSLGGTAKQLNRRRAQIQTLQAKASKAVSRLISNGLIQPNTAGSDQQAMLGTAPSSRR